MDSGEWGEILERAGYFVYHIDFCSGRYLYVSPAAASLFGIAHEQLLARGLETLEVHMDPGDFRRCREHFSGLCAGRPGEPRLTRVEYSLTTAAGEIRRYSDTITLVSDESGRPASAYGIVSDISTAWRKEKALRESAEWFRATMDAAQVGIFVVQDARFRYVNPFFARLLGYDADELVGSMGLSDFFPLEVALAVLDPTQSDGSESGQAREVVLSRADGRNFPAMIMGLPGSYGGRRALVGTLVDLSVLRAAEHRITELAFFDVLTGLPNRHLLRDRAVQALAAAERAQGSAALLVMDIDHFKRINDSLGHSVGDALLCAVAERLRGEVRKIDTLARLGGDEFVFVLPGATAADAAEVARRLLGLCAQPFTVGGRQLIVTPSLGASVYPRDGGDFEALLKNAEAAMYQAKQMGRNGFQFYASEMSQATLEHLLLASDLRNALARRELVLHYQPLVALDSGRIVGVEALIRWRHPEMGLIGPDRFIPVAEDSGLINAIGDWVLLEACRQAMRWQASGIPPLTMAVNVSPLQFRQAGFVPMVAGVLATTGLDAAWLELELTERTVMYDAEINLGTLSALHRMGVELAVDDFGTGYSSLAYLKRFPVSKLKIDRSFVLGIADAADDLAIASTIISMGRSLRLKVLAEGVENERQLELLRRQGCQFAQGYHFARPLSADECGELLRRQPFLI